ncbi:MAG TPA: potassium transporter TrkG [Clostridia bacterium]|nr:potassium transporter TrkG [Clostridia bacterium]
MKESHIGSGKPNHNQRKAARVTPARIIITGFILLILFGAFLLALPISSKSGHATGIFNALFTATSSVCVTGLVVVDTNTYWSLFGKVVILALIQIGALGIMSVVTVFAVVTGKSLGLKQRLALKESISNYSLENITSVFKGILKMSLILEGVGALIVSFVLVPIYGPIVGIGKSVFHAVSSFCNAGFDVFGSEGDRFTSLTNFNNSFVMLLTTAALIIVGGLGFIVWNDIGHNKRWSRLALHTKIVLLITAALLTAGTLIYMVFESKNTMAGMGLHTKLLNAFFHSSSARTAGFESLPLDEMNTVPGLFTIILMFIGAAPGSTGGGVKVTVIFVLAATMFSFLRGHHEVQVFERRITSETIYKCVSIFLLSATLVAITTMVLLINNEGTLMQTLFESVSAFGTVGLTTGITTKLGDVSKVQLIITMFLGRVGTITAFAALTSGEGQNNLAYRCPEGKIVVG